MLDIPEICVVEYTRQEVELLHNAEALSLCCHVPLEFLLTSLHLTFNGTATLVWIAVPPSSDTGRTQLHRRIHSGPFPFGPTSQVIRLSSKQDGGSVHLTPLEDFHRSDSLERL